jgi:hypothetical protein
LGLGEIHEELNVLGVSNLYLPREVRGHINLYQELEDSAVPSSLARILEIYVRKHDINIFNLKSYCPYQALVPTFPGH